ncbi:MULTISPECIES: LacI family DNA-binding transcriptional regulator [unclassified Streptomyces]|uniref:LacI family DNA-binding transcriptional regulator n=1 Tax=unclassified Streptomyces TaxID=2593676 RepID=UPI002DD7AFF2|nr:MULTISPECIES: LacI family DNA-binding transcriptional regulator [unclassified Streptomyces]WSA90740.1 LacI family transcriptional regulator [Streptomyces sp. NBC_01795]WSB75064.1 LacI family transcriptional regulator [Streptomyces sp. NBC_01775]WSS16655.1 LacI family transcriptional regulator [Streptomyces sp. NBC_01186]WSS45473.1 LacI family transcriptional regulator [Streptomyces sp. NBC_01187]
MVKITDVARRAGVSPSTVSYVLSGKRSISAATQRRVEESIRELGYRPHAGARALASSRSNVLALVMPLRSGIHVPVQMQFAGAVATAARAHDHDVLLLTQEEGEDGLRRVADSALVDALIVMDVQLRDARTPLLRALPLPSVLIGFPTESDGLTCIDLDFTATGESCVGHLAQLGHRCVALLGSPPAVYVRGTGFAQRTAAGFTTAAHRHGMTSTVLPCEPSRPAARRTVEKLLHDHPGLTGVVVHNEPALPLLMEAFQQAGMRIPQDLSVVAVCPDELAENAAVPVTSVAIPADEVGERAVQLLMAKLNGSSVADATLLPPRLTARASTSVCGFPS